MVCSYRLVSLETSRYVALGRGFRLGATRAFRRAGMAGAVNVLGTVNGDEPHPIGERAPRSSTDRSNRTRRSPRILGVFRGLRQSSLCSRENEAQRARNVIHRRIVKIAHCREQTSFRLAQSLLGRRLRLHQLVERRPQGRGDSLSQWHRGNEALAFDATQRCVGDARSLRELSLRHPGRCSCVAYLNPELCPARLHPQIVSEVDRALNDRYADHVLDAICTFVDDGISGTLVCGFVRRRRWL